MRTTVISDADPGDPDRIPTFSLYGEVTTLGQEMLHIEDVQSRSQLYQWEIEPHLHQGLYQVLWLYRGSAVVTLDGRRHRVPGPAAIVLPPGVVHGFRFEQGTEGMVLTLSARFLLEGEFQSAGEAFHSLFSVSGVLPLTKEPEVAQRLNALFHELLAEFILPGSDTSPVPAWLARSLVWRLSRAGALVQQVQGRRGHRLQALFMRFLLLVEQNFQEHWPLERYASRLGLSTPRLNRLVRAERGISALELVHERLTREACRRLVYVAVPVTRLAADLGFADPAYFSRFFKRRTGLSPQDYRRVHGGQD